jgi:PAS domain S-box-containing protein
MVWDRTGRPAWLSYMVSALAVIIAAAIRWQLSESLGYHANFVTFYPAVAIAGLHGGFGPGLLATVLSVILADYFWLPPVGHFVTPRGTDLMDFGFFLAGAILVSYLIETAYHRQTRAHRAEDQLKLAAERENEEKERKRLVQLRMDLIEYSVTHTIDELLSKALDEIGLILESPIGFYHLVEGDQKSILLQQWSTPTLKEFCRAEGKGGHYSLDQAGVWADAVRERKPVIHNDYSSLEHQKGMPDGHPGVVRELVVPVMREGEVVAVLGVGNKQIDYSKKDAETVAYLADVTWEIIERIRDAENIKQSEITLRTVLNQLPSGVTVRDASTGALVLANIKGREIAGTLADDATQFSRYCFFYSDGRKYRVEDLPFFRSMTSGEIVDSEEIEYERPDGCRLSISVSCSPIRNLQGQTVMSTCIFHDITERKMAEDALRENEERLRLFIRHAPASIAMFDREMRYLSHSLRWLSDHNLGDHDLRGLSHYDVFPEIPERWKQIHRRVLAGEVLKADSDCFKRSDGSLQWVRWEMRPWHDAKGEVAGALLFSEDITERKQMENELRKSRDELEERVKERTADLESVNEELRLVPSMLIEAQENERHRLARELHDSIGQTIAALKFRIENVITTLEKQECTHALTLLYEFVPILQRSIDETRSIYMGLKPMILAEYGILATLEWYRKELLKLYPNQHIELDTAIREEDIPDDLKMAIFRIAQEALNNASKHGKAEWVDVRIALIHDTIELEISDDGIGMDLDCIMESPTAKGLGLMGMRERTELTGGKFTIRATPGEGTTVKAVWRSSGKFPSGDRYL